MTGTENISLLEVCRLLASCCAVVISTSIMGRVRASSQPVRRREVHHLIKELELCQEMPRMVDDIW